MNSLWPLDDFYRRELNDAMSMSRSYIDYLKRGNHPHTIRQVEGCIRRLISAADNLEAISAKLRSTAAGIKERLDERVAENDANATQ